MKNITITTEEIVDILGLLATIGSQFVKDTDNCIVSTGDRLVDSKCVVCNQFLGECLNDCELRKVIDMLQGKIDYSDPEFLASIITPDVLQGFQNLMGCE